MPTQTVLASLGSMRDRADRLGVLVEDRLEGDAAVDRLPDAAAGGADVDGERIGRRGVEGRDAAARDRGADRAGLEAAEGLGVDLHAGGGRCRRLGRVGRTAAARSRPGAARRRIILRKIAMSLSSLTMDSKDLRERRESPLPAAPGEGGTPVTAGAGFFSASGFGHREAVGGEIRVELDLLDRHRHCWPSARP